MSLFPAVREGRVSLRMLTEGGTPLVRRYYCPKENRDVHPEHIVRGYEIAPEQYVVVRDEELEALAPEKSRDIDLRRFVPREQVDPLYLDHPYFLMPDKESNKAYRLLVETMRKSCRAGIATFVMRDKEYLVVILAEGDLLQAVTMRFQDEIRDPDDMGLPAQGHAAAADIKHVQQAIAKASAERFDPADLEDTRKKKLLALVAGKEKAHRDIVESQEPEEAGGRSVQGLMAALNASLSKARAAREEETGKAPTRRGETAKERPAAPRHATPASEAKPRKSRPPRKPTRRARPTGQMRRKRSARHRP